MNEPKAAEPATTVATTPAIKEDTVQTALQKMVPQFQLVLPKHLTPERLCRVAMNACHSTPKLLQCERKSLLSAIMRAAQLGLEPDGVLGQAYLIPFKRNFKDDHGKWQSVMEVQFIVGYKGLIDLARRSGDVSNIVAKEVYANDEFTIDWSQDMPFVHKPKMDGDRGEVTHFWAMARFKDGGFHWDYLTRKEVEDIRDKGNGGKNAVWADYFIEMGKKTAIRRIAKYLPMSVQKAAITEDLADAGKSFHTDDLGDIVIDQAREESVAIEDGKKGNDAVAAKLAAAKAAGANPETGELPKGELANAEKKEASTPTGTAASATTAQKTAVAQPELSDIPPALRNVAGAEKALEPKFSGKAIKIEVKKDNASEPDYEAYGDKYAYQCTLATDNDDLNELFKNNFKTLTQLEKADVEVYAKCERAYDTAKASFTNKE